MVIQKTAEHNMPDHNTKRLYYLDWLRVFVFAILILYHIGMLYVADWEFHYKSSYQSVFLQNLMLLVNRWRLPLLFFISGVAISYILKKTSWRKFIALRSLRLLIPLFFGVLIIVPPQLYIEMTSKGDLSITYWQFFQAFWDLGHPIFAKYTSGLLPHMDVNHLWYIRELWYFSIIIIPCTLILNHKRMNQIIGNLACYNNVYLLIIAPTLALSFIDIFFFPEDQEGRRIWMGFTFLIIGYLLARQNDIWLSIQKNRKKLLVIAIISYIFLIYYYHTYWLQRDIPLKGWQAFLELNFSYLNRWSWILAIIGYAIQYFSHHNQRLKYFNEAVYPCYILHQTYLIIAAYMLNRCQLGPILEPIIIILLTFLACYISFEIIRRFMLLRLLFGLKPKKTTTATVQVVEG